MKLFHATTHRKLKRYCDTGCILPPVRGWTTKAAAIAWARQTFRPIVLELELSTVYPLPDHKRTDGRAFWSTDQPTTARIVSTRANV